MITQDNIKSSFRDLFNKAQEMLNEKKKFRVVIMTEENFKTQKQNKLFHSLLGCFESSKMHSFADYDDLRRYYKRRAGLIKRYGDIVIESSWSDVKKNLATETIDSLIADMKFAGVNTPKFEEILKGINDEDIL